MKEFDVKKIKDDIVLWIQEWFEQNGKGCNAVIGISGGIDSSVVATLCVEALGKERVISVVLPQYIQKDIGASYMLINHLGIKSYLINIGKTVDSILNKMRLNGIAPSEQTKINLPARIRMSMLYAVSQSVNGRVMNTCNLSESYCGYDTRYGDSVADVSPLGRLTKTEVRLLGKELGLPDELVNKVPTDGLCGKTDEENFGFTYEVLDKYIRTGVCEDENVKARIDYLHEKNLFKQEPMPVFEYGE